MFNVNVKKDDLVFIFSNNKEKEDKRRKSNATLKRDKDRLSEFCANKKVDSESKVIDKTEECKPVEDVDKSKKGDNESKVKEKTEVCKADGDLDKSDKETMSETKENVEQTEICGDSRNSTVSDTNYICN